MLQALRALRLPVVSHRQAVGPKSGTQELESTEQSKRPFETLPTGTTIAGRYDLEKLLGVGAMGSVYLAKDLLLENELVALKILHHEFAATPMYAQRFLREVQLMRRISHPNIVRTYDVGADGELVYFTMEYVNGNSLDRLLLAGRPSFDQIENYLVQICSGLQAVHTANVIHRDLKPANVIITEDSPANVIVKENSVVKITDFGVARPEVSKLTGHNEVVGSAGYMAPEIWLGRKASPATDLYSLGVMLFELCTGRLPFEADSPGSLMRLHLDRQPTPLKELCPELPAWVGKLIVKLLAKSPQDRPRSAVDVIEFIQSHGRRQEATKPHQLPLSVGNAVEESAQLLSELEQLSATTPACSPEDSASSPQDSAGTSTKGTKSTATQKLSLLLPRTKTSNHVTLVSRLQAVATLLCLGAVINVGATLVFGQPNPIAWFSSPAAPPSEITVGNIFQLLSLAALPVLLLGVFTGLLRCTARSLVFAVTTASALALFALLVGTVEGQDLSRISEFYATIALSPRFSSIGYLSSPSAAALAPCWSSWFSILSSALYGAAIGWGVAAGIVVPRNQQFRISRFFALLVPIVLIAESIALGPVSVEPNQLVTNLTLLNAELQLPLAPSWFIVFNWIALAALVNWIAGKVEQRRR